jgi:hypothetical protein
MRTPAKGRKYRYSLEYPYAWHTDSCADKDSPVHLTDGCPSREFLQQKARRKRKAALKDARDA